MIRTTSASCARDELLRAAPVTEDCLEPYDHAAHRWTTNWGPRKGEPRWCPGSAPVPRSRENEMAENFTLVELCATVYVDPRQVTAVEAGAHGTRVHLAGGGRVFVQSLLVEDVVKRLSSAVQQDWVRNPVAFRPPT